MSSSRVVWPEEQARRVKLMTPKELLYPSAGPHCVLRFNESDRLLAIVNDLDGQVLDIIDVDDMIGAKLSFQFKDEAIAADNSNHNNSEAGERASNEPPTDELFDRQGSAVLTIFTYPRKDPAQTSYLNFCGLKPYQPKPNPLYQRPTDRTKLGPRLSYPRTFYVAPVEDLHHVATLVEALQHLATGRTVCRPPPTYLILVNPRSGPKRNGEWIASTIVQPMLHESGVVSEVCITTHANHAAERCAQQTKQDDNDDNNSTTKDLMQYDGLILMGGDGTIHEALQGIMTRDDHEQVLQKLKLGIVGCGTSNGLATSIAHHSQEQYNSPVDATYLICKNQSVPTDISQYQTTSRSYTSFLTLTWAIIADIDIESERLHFLGHWRYDVLAWWRVAFLRRYRGRLSYMPADRVAHKSRPISNMPKISATVPSDWTVVEDDFVLFWASQVSHAGATAYHSPHSQIQDGVFQILVVRGKNVSRLGMVRILLGIESGTHVGMPGVEFIECTAYRLEPLSPGSFNDLDGEVIEDGPVQGYVLPAAINVFGTPSL